MFSASLVLPTSHASSLRMAARGCAFALFVLVAGALPVQAQEHQAEHETEALQPFHAAGLIGETHNGDRNGVTFGGDFEYRFARWFGVGLAGEHVNEPFRENVWVFPLLVHPVPDSKAPGLKLTIGPGIERVREEGEASEAVQRGLWRLGAGYDVPLKHGWTLDPDFAVDFVAGERVIVYSSAVGKEFGRH